jgi:chromosomal replication initiation ATPase DnaA
MSLSSSAIIPNPWARILDALEKKINRHSYDTWLKPTRYSHASNGVLFVRIPTAEFRHVSDKYADLIQEAVDNLGSERRSEWRFGSAGGAGVAGDTGAVRLGQRGATESAVYV